MDYVKKALTLLPDRLRAEVKLTADEPPEELRLRVGRQATALVCGIEEAVTEKTVTQEDIAAVLEKASGASLHSVIGELCEGYISCAGIRIGVCGTAAVKDGMLRGFRDYTSLNIRIPGKFTGNIDRLCAQLMQERGNVLIISPPGGGKTTLLREIIRRMSDGGIRIGVVDERNELAAADTSGCGFDLGSHSDVLTGVRKSRGAIMLLRGMNPDIIAMDEITESGDIAAISEISGCGVALMATAHADAADRLRRRVLYRALLEENIFDFAIEIHGAGRNRQYTYRRLRT